MTETEHELPEHLQERARSEAQAHARNELELKSAVRRGAISPTIGMLLDVPDADLADGRPISYTWAKDPRWPAGREPYPHEVEILTLQSLERIEQLLKRLLDTTGRH